MLCSQFVLAPHAVTFVSIVYKPCNYFELKGAFSPTSRSIIAYSRLSFCSSPCPTRLNCRDSWTSSLVCPLCVQLEFYLGPFYTPPTPHYPCAASWYSTFPFIQPAAPTGSHILLDFFSCQCLGFDPLHKVPQLSLIA
jgi:hypothetical protein